MNDQDKELLERIDNGTYTDEDQLLLNENHQIEERFLFHYKNHNEVESIYKIGDRYFKLRWSQSDGGEYEDEFPNELEEVKPVKKMVEVTEWETVNK